MAKDVRLSYFVPRVRVVHWRSAEAEPLVNACRASGWKIDYEPDSNGSALARALAANPPDAIVIDLSRLPSHGRNVAVWLRNQKRYRDLPIVFANGDPDKVGSVQELLPDATYTDTEHVAAVLQNEPKSGTTVPPSMMERYSAKSVAEKLGIKPGMTVGVIDAPEDYFPIIGELPGEVEFTEQSHGDVTLWFVLEMDHFLASLRKMRNVAGKSKLWLIRKKGGLNEKLIREAAIEAGLVDYKICALHNNWSGILFARKKA